MAEDTKITLSEPELAKVLDSEWILTKHRIIEKVYRLLNQQLPVIRAVFFEQDTFLGEEVQYSVPKISKGENYLQLPYVILDYPAVFARDHLFALRTMFWWGNFFSVTLLLKGSYKQALQEIIVANLQQNAQGFFICINESEWEHHFEQGNYMAAENTALQSICEMKFLKLALKFDLGKWDEMDTLLQEAYQRVAGLMKAENRS